MWRLLVHLNTPPPNKWKLHLSKVDSSWTKLNVGLWRKKWWRKIDEEKIAEEKLVTNDGHKRTANRAEPSFIISTPVITVSSCTLFMTNRFIFFIICFTGVPSRGGEYLSICPYLYRPRSRAISLTCMQLPFFFSGIVYSVSPQLWQIDSFFRGFVQ